MIETSNVSILRYYIYVLLSLKDRKLYIGFTTDLKKRLVERAKGLSTATHARRPLKLIHYEYFINVEDAKARERFLKSGFGRNQLKLALKRTLKSLEYRHL
ncbi:MAG: GIY-YIG nuclease family protein [Candidatus Levybacteria bacterium]|nr:GIY-YIG nuclease family protein [Candidatus Levybacteria bacterium]